MGHASIGTFLKYYLSRRVTVDTQAVSVKERWEYKQPIRDVEQQLAGVEVKNNVNKELVDAILAQPGLSIEEEMCRQNKAIYAIIRYCGIEEGGLNPDNEALEAAKVSVYKDERPTICFLCLGNNKLPTQSRIYSFYTSGDLSKHFKRKNLQYIKEGNQLRCNLYRVDLDGKTHLRRNIYNVHGTVS
ncbi:hypothetical protein K432DRAFT_420771 [Lepidopterella palustris CBS 459.81]|uniref:Uncharacterized protein n=1 Tax=Lepidopterella palustris CBS 459.81 TaxID=1314670 RepID=A0A8E2J8J9_9PEZI|nr:hypothetical protein K432DRAFT_420771 [Lepidopterella palustris CBS 459.81]